MTRRRKLGRSGLHRICPCFSTNVTDDEGSDRGERMNGDRNVTSSDFIDQNRSGTGSNDYRSRLSIVGFDNESVVDSLRSVGRDVLPKDEPYVVHMSVDYTNCLLPNLDRIIASPYYWGVMDRFEAEALLEGKPEGTFLLRDSAQAEYLFSVSFRRYKRTLHARIEQKNHRFSFDFSDSSIYSADTITDLVAYYGDPSRCLFFEPQLSLSFPRNFPFNLQNLCRAKIASLTTFDGVESLSLPIQLKRFIQEYHYKHPVKTVNHIPNATDTLSPGPSAFNGSSSVTAAVTYRIH